jgi:hypothetical protein
LLQRSIRTVFRQFSSTASVMVRLARTTIGQAHSEIR